MGHRTHYVCTVPGCGQPHDARGLCNKHLKRSRRDAGWTAIRYPTPAYDFLQTVVLDYDGDDCLLWPFAKNRPGYAMIRIAGEAWLVSRRVCEIKHGPAPEDRPLAAHSCGNGHLGCVNPQHLRWASYLENREDARRHGTIARGERAGSAKLTVEQVQEIRSMRGRISQSKLSGIYGVSPGYISVVQRGLSWSHIPMDGESR